MTGTYISTDLTMDVHVHVEALVQGHTVIFTRVVMEGKEMPIDAERIEMYKDFYSAMRKEILAKYEPPSRNPQ